MPSILTALFLMLYVNTEAQTLTQKLATAFDRFEKDPQLQCALASLYIVDNTGKVVFQKNESIGLAPASTQKIVTSAAAYELLGAAFHYETAFGVTGTNSKGDRQLWMRGNGDPTLGSWRWKSTAETTLVNNVAAALKGIHINDTVVLLTKGWEGEAIPNGWIWEDVGNYYGAGAHVLNWRENQYDLYLRSGTAIGDAAVIAGTNPKLYRYGLQSKVVAAPKGSGDNAYIYFSPGSDTGVVRGTIPVGENHFTISGAFPNPAQQLAATLLEKINGPGSSRSLQLSLADAPLQKTDTLYRVSSPPLDSIIYWFLKKSINLYGEALLKTIAAEQRGNASTEAGVGVLKKLWSEKGIAPAALNIVDGSGLSPLNRITTHAQVSILQYAKKQAWFAGFYNALPLFNGMKLKSGTIHGVKGFAGYHTSHNGNTYTISFLVNNYNGSETDLVKKMYVVLDLLK